MMRKVWLTANGKEYELLDDLGCIVTNVKIGNAEPKTQKVDIPYGNGTIDLTEYFGEVRYKNRTIDISCTIRNYAEADAVYSAVSGLFAGRRAQIRTSEDAGYYYEGRCDVSDLSNNGSLWEFSISADCYPYKRRVTETIVTLSGSGTVTLANERMTVNPSFYCTGEATIEAGGASYALAAGQETVFTGLKLTEGETELVVTTDGELTITYRQGAL